jgi:hypothetical protein
MKKLDWPAHRALISVERDIEFADVVVGLAEKIPIRSTFALLLAYHKDCFVLQQQCLLHTSIRLFGILDWRHSRAATFVNLSRSFCISLYGQSVSQRVYSKLLVLWINRPSTVSKNSTFGEEQ